MKHLIKSAKYLLACIVVSMFVSCASPEEKFISNLTDLTEQIEDNGKNYTADDWEKMYDKYTSLMSKADDLDFTSSQQREIGKLSGRCVAAFGKAMGSQLGGFLEGLTSGAAGFFEGLQQSLNIEESTSGIMDEAKGAMEEAKGAFNEAKDAFKEEAKNAVDEAKKAFDEEAKGAVEEAKNALKGLFGKEE